MIEYQFRFRLGQKVRCFDSEDTGTVIGNCVECSEDGISMRKWVTVKWASRTYDVPEENLELIKKE